MRRTVVLLLSTCATLLADEIPVKPQTGVVESDKSVAESMRREMLTTVRKKYVSIPGGFDAEENAPAFEFNSFADQHGLKETRQALAMLLTDADSSVREQSSHAAKKWLRAEDISERQLRELLQFEDDNVAAVALKLAREGNLESSEILKVASSHDAAKDDSDNQDELRLVVVETLRDYVVHGDETALLTLRRLISDDRPEVAAAAIRAVGSLGLRARSAEPELRAALVDFREHGVAYSADFFGSQPNRTLAIPALEAIHFQDAATAEQLRKVAAEAESNLYEGSGLSNDIEFEAALALAVCRDEYGFIRQQLLKRMKFHEEKYQTYKGFEGADVSLDFSVTEAISKLLQTTPNAILEWDEGEKLCHRCLQHRQWRECESTWDAIKHYPGAGEVFASETAKTIKDMRLEYEDSSYVVDSNQYAVLVILIRLLNTKGMTPEDAKEVLITIGMQQDRGGEEIARELQSGLAYFGDRQLNHHDFATLVIDVVKQRPECKKNLRAIVIAMQPKLETSALKRLSMLIDDRE